MATRRDIRDAFYTELVTAASGSHTVTFEDGSTDTITVSEDDVALVNPGDEEIDERVVYTDSYVPETFNGVGAGPDWVERANDGSVVDERWREYITAEFLIQIRARSETYKEPIYEAAHTQFQQYNYPIASVSDLHSDIIDQGVDVLGAQSLDVGDEDDTVRIDSFEVHITFYRDYVLDTDNITTVNQEIDADLDSATTGLLFTTN